MLNDGPDHYRARGLPRPLPCSGTAQTTTMLGDCSDHCRARGLLRQLMCSGTVPTTARRSFFSATCDLYSHIVERHLFRPCYKVRTPPSSKLGGYIGTMHLPVHLVLLVRQLGCQIHWDFFLDPGTMCLRHLLPGSGTKWAHFTLR